MIYDTLKLSKALRASFTPEQSDTLAQAFSQSTEDNVATKVDIAELKGEIAALRAEMRTDFAALRAEVKTETGALRAEMKTEITALQAEMKTEITALQAEMKTEITALQAEMKAENAAVKTDIAQLRTEIATLKVDMVRWIVGAIAFNLLGTIGIMIAVAELVLKAK